MQSIAEAPNSGPEYRLDRVEKSEPPAGMQGDNWYRYVVKRKNGDITGSRCGSYQQVSSYAEALTDSLNARSASLGNPTWSRSRKG